MSSTGEADNPTSEDRAYFRTLEQRFLELRGKATLLAAEDWTTARAWRRSGIPIEVVVEVMEDLFARHRERGSKRGISSLRYFRAAVEAAWAERIELDAGGWTRKADPGPPPESRLRALAAALPAGLPGRERLVTRLEGLEGGVEQIEAALAELDRETLARLRSSLPEAERQELRERAARAAAVSVVALPPAEIEHARRSLEERALRERFEMPLLSLFAPEALGSPDED